MIDSVPDNLGMLGFHRGIVWDWGGYYPAGKGEQCSDGKDAADGLHFDLFWRDQRIVRVILIL